MNEKSFSGATIVCPSCKTRTFYQDQAWKRVCVACYLKAKREAPVPSAGAPIEAAMLRRLIQLCHPDKHGNSEASTTATAFLLTLRNETR